MPPPVTQSKSSPNHCTDLIKRLWLFSIAFGVKTIGWHRRCFTTWSYPVFPVASLHPSSSHTLPEYSKMNEASNLTARAPGEAWALRPILELWQTSRSSVYWETSNPERNRRKTMLELLLIPGTRHWGCPTVDGARNLLAIKGERPCKDCGKSVLLPRKPGISQRTASGSLILTSPCLWAILQPFQL